MTENDSRPEELARAAFAWDAFDHAVRTIALSDAAHRIAAHLGGTDDDVRDALLAVINAIGSGAADLQADAAQWIDVAAKDVTPVEVAAYGIALGMLADDHDIGSGKYRVLRMASKMYREGRGWPMREVEKRLFELCAVPPDDDRDLVQALERLLARNEDTIDVPGSAVDEDDDEDHLPLGPNPNHQGTT